jgi:EAL domain-containing protein (putative c-di-GMP-specific phosphodiesterase class I)
MYRAKSDGRGTYRFFEPEMDAKAQARRALEIDLRQALIEGAFELYYQPIVTLQTGNVSGCEALLRWKHPERGFVSPAEFIPVAEEIGLIVPIGDWALRQACTEAAQWPNGMRVAVNLSPIQFKSGNVVSSVMNALAASGLAPARLEVEVTESVLLEKTEENLSVLRNLHELGVRISLDDFGTGYSSLSYLQSFHFDKIKIDRSFVRDLRPDGDNLAIVRAIAGLGASFGITTTAEGVETDEELKLIRQEGCTEVQGYYFSPPKPAGQLPEILARIQAL